MFRIEILLRWKGTNAMWCEDVLIPKIVTTVDMLRGYCKEKIDKRNQERKNILGAGKEELVDILKILKVIKLKKEKDMVPKLKDLQLLAKEMQEGVGFDPPVNFKEKDIDKLIKDIKKNAADLDEQEDESAISDRGKKILDELEVGPWYEYEAEKEKDIEEFEKQEKEEPKVKKKAGTKKKAKVVPAKKIKSKPVKESKQEKPKKKKVPKAKQGQKKETIKGLTSSLLIKGTTVDEAAKAICKAFGIGLDTAKARFRGSLYFLKKDGVKIKSKNGVYKK